MVCFPCQKNAGIIARKGGGSKALYACVLVRQVKEDEGGERGFAEVKEPRSGTEEGMTCVQN